MNDFKKQLLSIRLAFKSEFISANNELEKLFAAVNSSVNCIMRENKEDDLEEHITNLQDICFLMKRFCSEANVNVKLLTPEDRAEQTDDLNKILPYERYSEVFTYPTVDPSKYLVGFEGKFAVTYIKDNVEHSIFVLEIPCPGINIEQTSFRYKDVPDAGLIFGVLLDGCLRRAVRENQLKIPAITFRVLLIDFGEIMEISKECEMYQLPEKIQKIPGQAIFCKLTMNDNCYDQTFLEDILHTIQIIRIKSILGNMLEVTVNPTEKSIMSESFESRNLTGDNASIHGGDSYKESIASSPCFDVKTNVGLTQENHEEPLNTENSLEAIIGYASQVDKRICKIANVTDCFAKVEIDYEIPMPPVGKKFRLLVSHVVNVEKFYGQIIPEHCHSPENLTVGKIVDEMNKNKMKSKLKPFMIGPAKLELVFAMYTDNLWYRAKIVKKTSDERYKVFYVDYGNCSYVTLDRLRKWEDEFDRYPFQALTCILDNVIKVSDNHEEATAYFESLVLNKPVRATVTYNVHHLRVTLQHEARFDIGEQLCASKYAQHKPTTGPVTVLFPG